MKNRKKEVKKLITDAKKRFISLDIEVRLTKIQESKQLSPDVFLGWRKEQKCPACEALAYIHGEIEKRLEPKIDDDEILESVICIPVGFRCGCCGLNLNNHADLFAAGFGEQYTVNERTDPKEFYDIDFDPEDYFDPNDRI